MRAPGLRLQLLLLLGGLLGLSFLLLHLALATFTKVTLRRLDESQAQALASVLEAYVREAEQHLPPAELMATLQRNAAGSGLVAARASGPDLAQPLEFGDAAVLAGLGADAPGAGLLHAGEQALLRVDVARGQGSLRLAIHAGAASARGASLIRSFRLYASLIAGSLLTLAYLALTRLIVRPLDDLAEAAQSVTLGSRQLHVPRTRVRELHELGDSLQRMTDTLLAKEDSLQREIQNAERATQELGKAQRELVRSERLASVGRLAAGLAHEIGNPIAALIGLQDLLLEGGLSQDEQRDFIKRMRAETERVNRTLRDLLQFARPARETSSAPSPPGDVEAAIHDTATLLLHQAALRDIELGIDVHPGLPRVTLDSSQLTQVVLNLLLNAADALQGRAGARISVQARASDAGVQIAVEDNGAGVPSEIAEHIFEPFFTTKEVGKGTGLGLSVCQSLVAAAGGSLSLDAAHSEGARFVVQLPVAEAAPS
ncbi:MAG TPA: ATP-binding protein [Polyangiaceae bacterium]|jgi:signal transduction histidine kinase|nr:ATP-binding protein [Polyangiaceae bacterium]